jgi:hypothetical protein
VRTGETRLLDMDQVEHEEGEGGGSEPLLQDKHGRFRPHPAHVRCLHAHQPTCGSTLLFFQTCLHEGAPVSRGCAKYLIRADVMFERIHTPFASYEWTRADEAAFTLLQQAEAIESQSVETGTAAESGEGEGEAAATAADVKTTERPAGASKRRRASVSDNKHCSAADKQALRDGKLPTSSSARTLREAAFRKSATVSALFGGSLEAAASAAVLWRTR